MGSAAVHDLSLKSGVRAGPPERAPFPERAPYPQIFELRCGDVHPVRCDVLLRAPSVEELVACTSAHGASAHGFTPVWYSPLRLEAIAQAARD